MFSSSSSKQSYLAPGQHFKKVGDNETANIMIIGLKGYHNCGTIAEM
jgi:hypothetical protein